jgi:hypothetical protein
VRNNIDQALLTNHFCHRRLLVDARCHAPAISNSATASLRRDAIDPPYMTEKPAGYWQ